MLSLNKIKPCYKSSLLQSLGRHLIFKLLWCIACMLNVLETDASLAITEGLLLFSTKKKEYTRNVKSCEKVPRFQPTHGPTTSLLILIIPVHVIDKEEVWARRTLESWHTANTYEGDNNSKLLPKQYSILLN